jgi:phosphonate metabolism protein PhnN/1,5-bisphosphokinase (PRPP-forming)
MPEPSYRGILFLVVGPSGAGKDSLISGARRALSGDPAFVFPRRAVTRPAFAGGSDRALDEAGFAAEERAGGFALSWRAHGFAYGVPRAIEADLAAGHRVVVNVSRAVIEEARRRYAPVRVVMVTAPPDVLARRLRARGRETDGEIARRLDRAGAFPIAGPDVAEIVNDGTLDDAIRRFVAVLEETPP